MPYHALLCGTPCGQEAVGKLGNVVVKSVGITNQRETTIVWHKHTGQPLCNGIVWMDIRTRYGGKGEGRGGEERGGEGRGGEGRGGEGRGGEREGRGGKASLGQGIGIGVTRQHLSAQVRLA